MKSGRTCKRDASSARAVDQRQSSPSMPHTTTAQNKYKHTRNEVPFAGTVHDTCPTVHVCCTCMSPPKAWLNTMLPMACFCHTEFGFLLSLDARQIALSWKRTKGPVGKRLPHGQASHWSWLYSRLFLPRLFDSKVCSKNTLGKKMYTRKKKNHGHHQQQMPFDLVSHLNVFQWI